MDQLYLSLFPLEVVLFPGQPMPLHVFEDRYKEMIGECLEKRSEFGVVLMKENAILNVGCTAEITAVTRRYKDGRMDLETIGRRRFEVLFLDENKSYLRAATQFFEDEDAAAKGAAREMAVLRRRAMKLHSDILDLLYSDQEERDRHRNQVKTEAPQLSFHLVGPLPVDVDFKQLLLTLRSEGERLEKVVEYLEKLGPRLRLTSRVRSKAGGNGQGR